MQNYTKELALIMVSFIWGTTFVLGKYTISHLPIYFYLALRFLIASGTLLLLGFSTIRKSSRRQISISLLTGALLFASYACQTTALQYTAVSKNAFICGLYVVLVPFVSYLLFKSKVTSFALISAFLAAIGLACLTLTGQEHFLFSYGDLLAFLSAVFAALQIVLVGRYAKEFKPLVLAFFQLVAVAVFSGLTAAFTQAWPTTIPPTPVIWTVLFLALPATTGAFLVQCWAQQEAKHTVTAIIFSLESVFGTFFAYLVLHEPLTGQMFLGCSLLFLAMILSQQEEKRPTLKDLVYSKDNI